jgi:hypothetical protein
MTEITTPRQTFSRDRNASPPAIYAFVFIGTTGLIGFATMIAAVAFA